MAFTPGTNPAVPTDAAAHSILWKLLRPQPFSPQRSAGHGVRPWRPAQSQIDTPGVQVFERPELLGDYQRWVVWQHDTARANPDRVGFLGNMAYQHRGRRAADTFHIVVFRQPEAAKPQRLSMAGIGNAVLEGRANTIAFTDRGQLQQGKGIVSDRLPPIESTVNGIRFWFSTPSHHP